MADPRELSVSSCGHCHEREAVEALQEHRDRLAEQLHTVYSGAPNTNTAFRAYKKAQEALQKLEDMTFTDAEIDAFLPKALKRDRPQM